MYKIKEPYTEEDVGILIKDKNYPRLFDILEWVECDVCGKRVGKIYETGTDNERFEFQEFEFINHYCGYGANGQFQDDDFYKIEICQNCLSKLLGPYMRKIESNEINEKNDEIKNTIDNFAFRYKGELTI